MKERSVKKNVMTSHFVQCKLRLFIIWINKLESIFLHIILLSRTERFSNKLTPCIKHFMASSKYLSLLRTNLWSNNKFIVVLMQFSITFRYNDSLDTISSSSERLKIFLRHKCTGKFAIQLNNPLSVRFSSNDGCTIDIFLKIPSSKTSNETSTSRTVGASLKLLVANRGKFTLLYWRLSTRGIYN